MRKVPKEITELVQRRQILFSAKARRELDEGRCDSDDLMHSSIHGNVIKKERDEKKESQYKYTIIGPSRSGTSIYSCGKVVKLLRKVWFVITFHEAR